MKRFAALRNAWPMLFTVAAGGMIGKWLWGRWFSPGGEFLHGCVYLALVAGCLATLIREKRHAGSAHPAPLVFTAFFLIAAAVLYGRTPTLFIAALYTCAVYWSYRSSPACVSGERTFSLWPLLMISLPVTPSLQFVFGYPLRALAARAATLLLPSSVRATGSGLGDGTVEVFVDAPCAGAGMLVSSLFLAAGAALVFSFGWRRCGVMLIAGTACALSANAVRAAALYLGTAGMIAVPLHRYEEATGLFCFIANAATLAFLAWFMAKWRRQPIRAENGTAPSELVKPRKSGAAFFLPLCAAFFAVTAGVAGARHGPPGLPDTVVWPETWNGEVIVPREQSPETARFWSSFPGRCQEFTVLAPDGARDAAGAAKERIVMRFVTRPTRLLHPAEDCFRGSGYSVSPEQARKDGHDRIWSGFNAQKNGRKYSVRQCVISVDNYDLRTVETSGRVHWPDVSSWYWEVAKPGSGTAPAALAITVISQK